MGWCFRLPTGSHISAPVKECWFHSFPPFQLNLVTEGKTKRLRHNVIHSDDGGYRGKYVTEKIREESGCVYINVSVPRLFSALFSIYCSAAVIMMWICGAIQNNNNTQCRNKRKQALCFHCGFWFDTEDLKKNGAKPLFPGRLPGRKVEKRRQSLNYGTLFPFQPKFATKMKRGFRRIACFPSLILPNFVEEMSCQKFHSNGNHVFLPVNSLSKK